LDVNGVAWLFGRNSPAALGEKGDVVSENAPRRLKAPELGAPAGTKFVHAACGRGHSLLVGSNGQVWTAGVNNMGQVSLLRPWAYFQDF
jgi:alpha-tubulin suppressor-like RCC1 family protein